MGAEWSGSAGARGGRRGATGQRADASERWSAAAGFAVVVGAVALDLATPPNAVFIGLTVLGPLVASFGARARDTAAIGVIAVVAAISLGVPDAIFGTADHLIRIGIVAATSVLAVYAARQRRQRKALLRRLSRVAELAQHVMLRPPPAVLGHVGLAARYQSASDDSLVGGDLYETAYTPYGVRLILGDVRGKGLDGIRLAATVLATFREMVWDRDLVELMRLVDERVSAEASDEDFVTAVVVEFPPSGGVSVVNCGHHPPFRLRDGGLEPLEPTDPDLPLGLGPEPVVDRFDLEVGDRLLLCTDGVLEARDAQGRFFPFAEQADALALPDLQAAVDALVDRVLDHLPGRLDDDLAVVLAARLPVTEPPGRVGMADPRPEVSP